MKSEEHKRQFIGEIATGLAHEMSDPLTGIKGALEVFLGERDLSAEDRAVVEEMLIQVKKLNAMTKSFLEYAQLPSPQMVPSNITDIINTMLSFLLKHNLHANIKKVKITKELDGSVPIINADPAQLYQVILNLTINALDSMAEGGILRFRTSHDNKYVEIEVSHTGNRLDNETMSRIFQPFFITRTTGFGVGLSVSKRLIEQHGGELTVDSGEKETIFMITLPIRENFKISKSNI